MPVIAQELQRLVPDALVVLYELRPPAGVPLAAMYFTASGAGEPVTFAGQRYEPWGISAEGFASSSDGAAPRPTLTVSNVVTTDDGRQIAGVFSALVRQYAGLAGWVLVRRLTHAKFCAGGALAAQPEQHQDEIWQINRRLQSDGATITFELVSQLDFVGVKAPGIIATVACPPYIRYRGAECAYGGAAMFDVNDQPTTDPAKDVCSKRLSGCRCRGNTPQYGGYPGMRRYG